MISTPHSPGHALYLGPNSPFLKGKMAQLKKHFNKGDRVHLLSIREDPTVQIQRTDSAYDRLMLLALP